MKPADFAATFAVGDVVEYEKGEVRERWTLAIVRAVRLPPKYRPSLDLVHIDGGASSGPGLAHADPPIVRHREPRVRVAVTASMFDYNGDRREEAVCEALRAAGVIP